HRQDVRRIMLGLLRTESPGQFDAINCKAVEFYSDQTAGKPTVDPAARAEEIYHRLARGESVETVEPLWVDGVEEFLRGSVEDVTDAEPATFLASRLGVDVPGGLWDKARTKDWELQAAKRAEDLIKLNDPAKALAVINSREGQRLPGSPLYLLEARLRLQQDDSAAAASIARAGIRSAAAAGNDVARLDLLLFLADVLCLRGEGAAARTTLAEAVDIATRLSDPMRAIETLARFLRLGRALGVPRADDAAR